MANSSDFFSLEHMIDVPIAHVPSEEIILKINYGTYTKEFPF